MHINIKLIKPKGKTSDKYSIQLYNYLKRNYPNGCNVYYIQTQDVYNKKADEYERTEIPFDSNKFKLDSIWVGTIHRETYNNDEWKGTIDWIYGNRMRSILSQSGEKYTVFANPWENKKTVVDITDWFWNEYIAVGRCIFDRSHSSDWKGEEGRYTYVNKNSRKCNWCGKWQHREIEKVVWVNRKDRWVTNEK